MYVSFTKPTEQEKAKEEKRKMPKTTIEETLNLIPSLFEINLNTDKSGMLIFEKLSQILEFDEGFIYFFNPDSLQLKYSFKVHKTIKLILFLKCHQI